ncbi:MAG: hypothetical protein WAS07_15980 [Micropruina sp.]
MFGALGNDRFAGGFDGSGADEPPLFAVVVVLHAVGVGGEVAQRAAGSFADAAAVGVESEGVDLADDGGDVAAVEVADQLLGEGCWVGQDVVEDLDEVVDVFAGVPVVDDVGGFGEESFGDVPDPLRAVTDDDGLTDAVEPAAGVFGA